MGSALHNLQGCKEGPHYNSKLLISSYYLCLYPSPPPNQRFSRRKKKKLAKTHCTLHEIHNKLMKRVNGGARECIS